MTKKQKYSNVKLRWINVQKKIIFYHSFPSQLASGSKITDLSDRWVGRYKMSNHSGQIGAPECTFCLPVIQQDAGVECGVDVEIFQISRHCNFEVETQDLSLCWVTVKKKYTNNLFILFSVKFLYYNFMKDIYFCYV